MIRRISLFFVVGLLFFPSLAVALERQSARVAEALTGDTVRLEGGKILKYIGVQSPPLQHMQPLVRQYGEEAKKLNQQLAAGKQISIEWGSQIRDEAGQNLLGYVFLPDGTFVNQKILESGYGKAISKAPNIKYAPLFRKTALAAQRAGLGMWREEPKNPFLMHDYIGDKNTKIYYFPTSPELEHIPQSFLVTFRSRVEAKAAGYKPCFDCDEDAEALF